MENVAVLVSCLVAAISFLLGEAFQLHKFGVNRRLQAQAQANRLATPFNIGAPIKQVTQFMHLLQDLKLKKRTGWVQYGIPENEAESIADHMYRMAMMAALFSDDPNLDIYKCIKMALVHDLAEAITGDITPQSNVPADEKHRLESEAMAEVQRMLAGNPLADEAVELWEEYASDSTPNANFVKDLDKTELIYQVVEYENKYKIDFTVWIENAQKKIRNPTLKAMAEDVLKERPAEFQFWDKQGANNEDK